MKPCSITLWLCLSFTSVSFAQGISVGTPPEVEAASQLGRKVVNLGTHKVTYIRITPPRLPATPVAPPASVVRSTPEQISADEARAAKTYAQLSVSVTVYPATADTPTVADLSWWHEGKRYQAWSNVDFRLLTQMREIETATHIFSWFPFVGEGSVEQLPGSSRPAGFSLFTKADTFPQYYFEGGDDDMAAVADTLAGLDYVHAYYQLHRERLAAEMAQRVTDAAARKAESAKNPPKPVDTTIHFWKKSASATR